MTPSALSNETRPIIGIENRTPQEVFDIMCDRIKSALSPSTERGETIEACARIAEDYAERHRYVGPDANLRIAAAIRALNPSGSGERS